MNSDYWVDRKENLSSGVKKEAARWITQRPEFPVPFMSRSWEGVADRKGERACMANSFVPAVQRRVINCHAVLCRGTVCRAALWCGGSALRLIECGSIAHANRS